MAEQNEPTPWAGEELQHQREMNTSILAELRERQGPLEFAVKAGADMLILHTTGAKTGKVRELPLGCTTIDDELVIIASFQGGPRHPGWYYNLVAHPDVTVEHGAETLDMRARVLSGDERTRVFEAVKTKLHGAFGEYETRAATFNREIPVIILDPR
jgi:deazaflavin-dependent oxidoreductase (nitroreductase family)